MSDARTPSVNPDGSDPTPIAELEPNNRAGSASSSGRGRRVVTAALLTSMLAGAGAVALIVNNGDATPKAERTARKLAKLHLRSGSAPLSAGAAHDEGFKRSAMPYANFEYTHSGAWPDLAKTATVYKVNAPTVDQAAAERIARAVGITSAVTRTDQGWNAHDTKMSLDIMMSPGSGTVISVYPYFGDGGLAKPGVSEPNVATPTPVPSPDAIKAEPSEPQRPVESPTTYVPPPAPTNLPSASEATRIAQDLLKAMGANEDWKVEVLDGSSFATAIACPADTSCPTQTTTPATVYSRTVMFHRQVDGHTVNGLDWSVEVGDNGVIASVFGVMADLEVMDNYPLRSVDAVYNDVKDGKAFMGGGGPLAAMAAKSAIEPAVGAPEIAIDTPAPDTPTPDTPTPETPTPETPAPRGVSPLPGDATTVAPDGNVTVPDTAPAVPLQRVSVTGVSVGYQLWSGVDGNTAVSYIVPTYSFTGSVSGSYDGAWSSDVIALDQSFIDTRTPAPLPEPGPVGEDNSGSGGSSGGNPGASEPPVSVSAPTPTR